MIPTNVIDDYLPVLDSVPSGGMVYYLQFDSLLRGRHHQNTFFCTFNGGEKTVLEFFQDQHREIAFRLVAMQSWDVFQVGYMFVRLFPPPYVIMYIPTALPGFHIEPAAPNKVLAIAKFQTEQTGRKRHFRKYLFGMPASWIEEDRLNDEGRTRIISHVSSWGQLWHTDYTEWPYTMGKMNRWVNRVLHSPLNPINYWPLDRWQVDAKLVKHLHPRAYGHS